MLPGQTLVEMLIAAAVISSGLFAAATIVFSNLALSDRIADEVVAVNLAREGVEEAKELRDSNWLAGLPFDDGLHSGRDYSAVPLWDGAAASANIQFDFTAGSLADANAVVHQSSNLATPGFFTQSDPSAPATVWKRLLIFHPICNAGGTLTYKNDGELCGSDPKIGIRVESHIQWVRKGTTFDRTIYEDLFDWR